MNKPDINSDNKCLCGCKSVTAYFDGGSNICEKGHVYHFCEADSTKKYGWVDTCFDSNIPCPKLPIQFDD